MIIICLALGGEIQMETQLTELGFVIGTEFVFDSTHDYKVLVFVQGLSEASPTIWSCYAN